MCPYISNLRLLKTKNKCLVLIFTVAAVIGYRGLCVDGAQNSSSLLYRVSLRSSGCPVAHSVVTLVLNLQRPTCFSSCVLGLKCAVPPYPEQGLVGAA